MKKNAVLRAKFIAMSAYIKNSGWHKINDVTMNLRTQTNSNKPNPKLVGRIKVLSQDIKSIHKSQQPRYTQLTPRLRMNFQDQFLSQNYREFQTVRDLYNDI